MRLTFVTDMGQSYAIEVDPQMEFENIMALLEADVSDRSSLKRNERNSSVHPSPASHRKSRVYHSKEEI